jgi:hypothetical protein
LEGTGVATSSTNSQISVATGWTGIVGALNLYANSDAELTIISYWDDHTVVIGAGANAAITINKITLGKFLGITGSTPDMAAGTSISANTVAGTVTGYRLKAADGTLESF